MALEVRLIYDVVTDDSLLFVSERVGEAVHAIEPAGADNLVQSRLVKLGEPRKPLFRFSGAIARELLTALSIELAREGYRAPDPQDGALAVTRDALLDARTVRDRLLTMAEKG